MKGVLLISAVLAVSVPLAVWASGAGARDGTSAGATIHVVEHAVTDAITNGTQADRLGNVLTFANPVYDQADKRKVGTDNGFCVRTVKGKAWECLWTTFLSAGQITVEGPFSDTGNTVLAITGGTGMYASVRGSMDLKYHNKKGTEFDFVFHTS
jgi:Allene oxide cyclase